MMKTMKSLVLVVLCVGVILCMGSYVWGAAKINFLASSFGTGTYILGLAYEDISKRFYPDLDLTMRETPGLTYNLRKLAEMTPEERKETVITAYDGLTWMAMQGKPPFKEPLKIKIKALWTPNGLATYFMTKNPNIKTMQDLAGKTVAIGTKAMLGWGQHPAAYLEAAGVKDKVKIQWVGLKAALTAFKDNLVDAMPSGFYCNPVTYDLVLDPQTEEILSTGERVYFISPGSIEACKKIEKLIGLHNIITLPPNKIKYQDKPLVVNVGINYYAATEDLPDESAYNFVKMMLDNVGRLKAYHALGKLTTKESMAFGMNKENLHPGAYKAFKEAGVLK
jgi:TRAP transporter TAXI family solute receptor